MGPTGLSGPLEKLCVVPGEKEVDSACARKCVNVHLCVCVFVCVYVRTYTYTQMSDPNNSGRELCPHRKFQPRREPQPLNLLSTGLVVRTFDLFTAWTRTLRRKVVFVGLLICAANFSSPIGNSKNSPKGRKVSEEVLWTGFASFGVRPRPAVVLQGVLHVLRRTLRTRLDLLHQFQR